MGMDLTGIQNPGAYFRADMVEWPFFLEFLKGAIEDTEGLDVDEDQMTAMSYNDGGGLDEEQCALVYPTLVTVLQSYDEVLPLGWRMGVNGTFAGLPLKSDRTVDHQDVAKFIQFINECGGFEIY